MSLTKFLIPVIGSFIGWFTNVIAISLLFHPYKRRLGVQGLIPKNRDRIAERLGVIISEHLLDAETVINSINLEEKIKEVLKSYISKKNSVTKAVLSSLIDPVSCFLRRQIENELRDLPQIIRVDKIIEKRVKEFDLKELEMIIYKASGSELRFIQGAGAIIGFIIGLVQLLIINGLQI